MNLCRKLYQRTYAMIGQAKISSFFSPAQKRNASDAGNEKSENTLPKKAKVTKKESSENSLDKNHTSPQRGSSPPGIQLSPEQKQRIDENRCQALAKLHQKKASGLLVDFGKSWYTALEPEFTKPYFKQLSEFVEKERLKATVYPTPENVFSWTRACEVSDVKVVILGQDPYHGPNQAHGLCFSVLPGVPPPPSLVNMYKELVDDIEGFERPKHGYLQGWAKQGVLLLNAVLTVRSHQANSHKDKGWEKFTDATISYLNKNKEGIVFMLWGGYAQKKGAHIDKTRHHILKSVHPSPLSAHRGFLGCKHFSKCNELLKSDGKAPIDWNDLTEA